MTKQEQKNQAWKEFEAKIDQPWKEYLVIIHPMLKEYEAKCKAIDAQDEDEDTAKKTNRL